MQDKSHRNKNDTGNVKCAMSIIASMPIQAEKNLHATEDGENLGITQRRSTQDDKVRYDNRQKIKPPRH